MSGKIGVFVVCENCHTNSTHIYISGVEIEDEDDVCENDYSSGNWDTLHGWKCRIIEQSAIVVCPECLDKKDGAILSKYWRYFG